MVGRHDVPVGVDDVGAHPDHVAVQLRRVRPFRCLDDPVCADLDRPGPKGERLDGRERAAGKEERGKARHDDDTNETQGK